MLRNRSKVHFTISRRTTKDGDNLMLTFHYKLRVFCDIYDHFFYHLNKREGRKANTSCESHLKRQRSNIEMYCRLR